MNVDQASPAEIASWICFYGSVANPALMYFVATSGLLPGDRSTDARILFSFVLLEAVIVIVGLASFVGLPRNKRGWVIARSVTGIIIGGGAGFCMFMLAGLAGIGP